MAVLTGTDGLLYDVPRGTITELVFVTVFTANGDEEGVVPLGINPVGDSVVKILTVWVVLAHDKGVISYVHIYSIVRLIFLKLR